MSYSGDSSNYRLYDPIAKKVTVSRDVVFNESNGEDLPSRDNQDIFNVTIKDENQDQENSKIPGEEPEIGETANTESSENNPSTSKFESHQLRDRGKLNLPKRYQANFTEFIEPEHYEEAIYGPEGDKWKEAFNE